MMLKSQAKRDSLSMSSSPEMEKNARDTELNFY